MTAPSHAYTTLWTADQVRRVRMRGLEGQAFSMTFGGPHRSAPSFRRAGVKPGDWILPIQVRDGRLFLLAGLHIAELLDAEEYVARDPEQFGPIHDHPEFRRLEPHMHDEATRALWLLRLWLQEHPDIDALCPGEATEVVLGLDADDPASVLRLERMVPSDIVAALRWQSGRRPQRAIKHLAADGRIERSISLQGIYRLTPPSADLLRSLL